jgi:integrase
VSADVLDDLKTRYADSTSVITFDRISGALALAYARRVRPVPAPKAPMAVTDLESPGIALEDDELAAVRRAVAVDPELSDAVALMIQTGMRVGEVCALQGGDLDLRRGALMVRRTVKADQRSTGKPKNGKRGVRLIVIDPARESAVWRMLIARRGVAGRGGYLFHRSVTTNSLRKDPALYALPSRMRERWERLVRGALGSEVPEGVRLHDLRHTNGSVLLASGRWDPIAVARRLGMSLVMLERIYGHDLATTQDAMGAFAAEWGAEGEAASRRAAIHAV